jgi:hypothetical protein
MLLFACIVLLLLEPVARLVCVLTGRGPHCLRCELRHLLDGD